MAKTITSQQLAEHNVIGQYGKPGDMWLAIAGDVYDVSKFARLHPGGGQLLEQLAGRDVTEEFFALHRIDVLSKYKNLKVGRLEGAKETLPAAGTITTVPFADAPAFQGANSPYYKDSHRRLQRDIRRYVQEKLMPVAEKMDLAGETPDREMKQDAAMNGILISRMGPGPWMHLAKGLGIKIPGDVPVEEFDYFHEMIAHQEMARLGLPGFIDGFWSGVLISLPAIFHFGSEEMKKTVGYPILTQEKQSCLAISEPFAGSDVAGVKTTAEKTPDGKFYIVNGVKKWITEGMTADYFVTAVRTGGPGAKGMSMLLIERGPGVETRLIKTTYSTAAATALVIFHNAKVPVSNLLGKEGEGFKQVMFNFNHERWFIVNNLLGMARAAVADAFMWSNQRMAFGKPLIDKDVIKHKLANSIAQLESISAFNESVTYDMSQTEGGPLTERIGGLVALLKYQATRACWNIADDTVQVMGGRGITRTGMGNRVEGFKNMAKYAAVYGGSEEIMTSIVMKQALKNYPKDLTAKL
jgi:alkylation response protein AidB-like acyl-CoA dehydrogenase/predicted heme/steroid binding protein